MSNGNLYLAYIDTAAAGERPGTPTFAAAFQRNYAAQLATLPWAVYGDRAQERVGQGGIFSRGVVVGSVAEAYQPQVDAGGSLDERPLRDLIGAVMFARDFVPLKAPMPAADRDYLRRNEQRKLDIWPGRELFETRNTAIHLSKLPADSERIAKLTANVGKFIDHATALVAQRTTSRSS